jgi:hypothetical protein
MLLGFFRTFFLKASQIEMMPHNLLRWMGEPAFPQLKGHLTKG